MDNINAFTRKDLEKIAVTYGISIENKSKPQIVREILRMKGQAIPPSPDLKKQAHDVRERVLSSAGMIQIRAPTLLRSAQILKARSAPTRRFGVHNSPYNVMKQLPRNKLVELAVNLDIPTEDRTKNAIARDVSTIYIAAGN